MKPKATATAAGAIDANSPELAEKVFRGEMTLTEAEGVVTLSAETWQALTKQVEKLVKLCEEPAAALKKKREARTEGRLEHRRGWRASFRRRCSMP